MIFLNMRLRNKTTANTSFNEVPTIVKTLLEKLLECIITYKENENVLLLPTPIPSRLWLLTTPIFYFQQVVSAFTIPLTTPSLVKTSLKKTNVGRPVIYSPACLLDVSSVNPLNLLSLCLLLLSTMVKASKKGKWLKNWLLPKKKTFSVLKTFI